MSAAIFVVLAVGWAGYLIPKVLKHHEEVARTRSIDRFSHTMRVLARRDPVSTRDARPIADPERAPGDARAQAPTNLPSRPHLQARRRAAAAAARRRRRILVVLLLGDVVVGTLTGLGYLLLWSVAIPGGVTLFYLMLCRLLVRKEHRAWEAEFTHRLRSHPGPETVDEMVEQPTVRLRNAQGFEEFAPDEDTAAIDVPAVAVPVPTTDGGFLWDPLPITLPTYVGKPKATRTVRTIDLSAPDVSSSGRDAADSQLVAEAQVEAQSEERETDVARKAVNG